MKKKLLSHKIYRAADEKKIIEIFLNNLFLFNLRFFWSVLYNKLKVLEKKLFSTKKIACENKIKTKKIKYRKIKKRTTTLVRIVPKEEISGKIRQNVKKE